MTMTGSEAKGLGCLAGGAGWLLLVLLAIVCLAMWGCPQYHVYEQGLVGAAKLKEAESSRQILVQEAQAKKEAAKLLAEAEIERAKGVAEANRILGEGLKGHEEYLMYLWIQSLGDHDNHVIYVPTEANLPILEAGRFAKPIKGTP
jgi:hypothetical protein